MSTYHEQGRREILKDWAAGREPTGYQLVKYVLGDEEMANDGRLRATWPRTADQCEPRAAAEPPWDAEPEGLCT